jgi:opacity protein-like surface antigen
MLPGMTVLKLPARLFLLLSLTSCATTPDLSYPWPGSVSVGLTAKGAYDSTATMNAYSMPDPDGFGSFFQVAIDPLELAYLLGASITDEDGIDGGNNGANYSFTRKQATFGLGYGLAHNLGDRWLVFTGAGWAMAFEHEFDRRRVTRYRSESSSTLHYLTSGLNLTAGLQWRTTPSMGLEIGYQSFYETLYVGISMPF